MGCCWFAAPVCFAGRMVSTSTEPASCYRQVATRHSLCVRNKTPVLPQQAEHQAKGLHTEGMHPVSYVLVPKGLDSRQQHSLHDSLPACLRHHHHHQRKEAGNPAAQSAERDTACTTACTTTSSSRSDTPPLQQRPGGVACKLNPRTAKPQQRQQQHPHHSTSATIFFLRSGLTLTVPGALWAMRRCCLRLSASWTVRRSLDA